MPRRADHRLPLLAVLAAGAAGVAFAQVQPAAPAPAPPAAAPAPAPSPAPAAPAAQPAAPSAPRTRAPDLSLIEDIVGEQEEAALEPPPPPVEYPDDRRRDPAMVGVLAPETLGLSPRPWGAAGGKFLSVLLRRTDAPLASRWAQIGLRGALLAYAPAPHGIDPADWVAERAWLLLRLGEADAAQMLVAGIDTDRFTPKLVQVAAQVALATSDPSGLCAIETSLPEVEPRIAPLTTAICASLAGESERAAADIERARRRGRLSPIDLALADKLVGAGGESRRAVTVEWEPVTALTTWSYGLSTATAMMPPERLIDRARPQLRAWLARAPMFSAMARMKAAQTAAALGVMSSDAMVDLYSEAYDATDPDELGGSDPWRLRQAFVGKDREARLNAMRELWGEGKDRQKLYAGWVTTARAATLVRPDPAVEKDIPNLIAAMLAGGYDRQAARWVPVIADIDDEPADAAWAMLALGAGSAAGLEIDAGRIADFAGRDSSPGRRRTALLVAGLAGLGRIDTATASRLNSRYGLRLDRRTTWTRLIDGAAARRQGGTAMVLAASAMQAPSASDISPLYLFHATTALRRTGQEAVARMIAAEALARA